ncbi:MAG: glycosyltransferase family 9 protein [Minisyncoccia bacterium]
MVAFKKEIEYLTSNPFSLKIKKLIDFWGYILFNRNKKVGEIDLRKINSITIVHMGHIGDIVLMLPMIDALRNNFKGKIILVVNQYVRELAKLIRGVDKVYSVPHPKFSRTNSTSWFETFKIFKGLESDIVFEAGCYFFSIPFSFLIRKKLFVGYNVSGLGFLFDVVLDYPFNRHIIRKYFKFLDFLSIPEPQIKPLSEYLLLDTIKFNKTQSILRIEENYIVLGIGAGAQAKDWPDDYFIQLVERLSELNIVVVLVGKLDLIRAGKYKIFENNTKVINLINKTNIGEVLKIIERAKIFIGLDSGLTHCASMLGIKTVAIFSGTTGIGIWDPINLRNNVYIFRANVPCNNNGQGCGLKFCQDNICMKFISPEHVYQKVKNQLE